MSIQASFALLLALVPQSPAPAKPAAQKPAEEVEMPTLYVGDDAPPLSVTAWVRGPQVEKFEKGKSYLVAILGSSLMVDEVLAPLTQLQKEQGPAGLTVFATANESMFKDGLARAKAYAEKHAAEIGFAFGFDGDSLMDKNWRLASKQLSPPNYFLVDRQGKVAWIGEVEDIGPTLKEVLAGTQDLARAAAKYHEDIRFELRTRKHVLGLVGANAMEKWDKVIEHIDALLALEPVRMGAHTQLRMIVLGVSLQKPDEAYAFAKTFVDGVGKDSPAGLNGIARAIVDPEQHLDPQDLELASRAARRAVQLTKEKDADLLDTLVLTHMARKEFDAALLAARKAAALDKQYEARVAQLQEEADARKKSK